MRNILLSSTAVAAILAAAPLASTPAFAGQITHTYTGSTFGNGGFTIPLALFDSSGGSLSSVIVVESLTSSFVSAPGSAYWKSGGSYTTANHKTPSTTTFDPTATTSLTASGGPSSLDGAPILSVTADNGRILFSAKTPQSFNAFATSGSVAMSTPDLAHFAASGGGISTLSYSVLTVPTGDAAPGGKVSLTWPNNSPQVNYSLSVTYDYNASEPASILVLGAGLIGLAGIYRRNRPRPQNSG